MASAFLRKAMLQFQVMIRTKFTLVTKSKIEFSSVMDADYRQGLKSHQSISAKTKINFSSKTNFKQFKVTFLQNGSKTA